MAPYDFSAKLKEGHDGEEQLDELFNEWYFIERAGMQLQKVGVDRVYRRRDNKHPRLIEYKTDWTAGRTGNAFIETVSVAEQSKAGWAYTSCASIIMYYVPDTGKVYALPVQSIREKLPEWQKQYKEKLVPNRGYTTKGIPVPLPEIEAIAVASWPIEKAQK